MTGLNPEHDALLFFLDRDHAETVLAADAVVRTIDVLDRARRRHRADGVPRWALVARVETLRAPDRPVLVMLGALAVEAASALRHRRDDGPSRRWSTSRR